MTYAIEITEWNLPYHFAISPDLKPLPGLPEFGPFWEHRDILLRGKFLAPDKVHDRTLEIRIAGNRNLVQMMEQPHKYTEKPRAIGTLTVWGKQSEGYINVPYDALNMLCLLLMAGKSKFLILSGPALYRGHADLSAMYFEKEYKSEDWN